MEDITKAENPIVKLINEHAKFFTYFSAALIVIVGTTIVRDPGKSWISLLAVLFVGVALYILLNARLVLKTSISLLAMVLEAAWAFKVGALLDPSGLGGTFWFVSIAVGFFACLGLSYTIASARGRWLINIISTTIAFLITYIFTALTLNIFVGIIIGFVANITIFVLLYKYNYKTRFKTSRMPEVLSSDAHHEKIVAAAQRIDWGASPIMKRGKLVGKNRGKHRIGTLVWCSERAYALTDVALKQSFGDMGIKKQILSYQGKNINPWLMKIAYYIVPTWFVSGADITLVLLDTENKNGIEPKAIGVKVPDSKKVIPVAVMPAQGKFDSPQRTQQMLESIHNIYKDYGAPLNTKQLRKLDGRLPAGYENSTTLNDDSSQQNGASYIKDKDNSEK